MTAAGRNGQMLNTNQGAATVAQDLAELVYELLDAHGDTMRLALESEPNPDWAVHLDYLRGLQRVGRETLARISP